MIYANIQNEHGKTDAFIFDTWSDYIKATFSPFLRYYAFELTTHGKTYAERKADLTETAKMFQYYESEVNGIGLSYYEVSRVQGFFETNGKRYGLLTEFRENAII